MAEEASKMFRGNHPAKVDEKGRLKLPAAFKQLLDAQHVSQFYITSTDGARADIWPLPVWERLEGKLAEFSTMNDAVEKYLSMTGYYGQQVEVDQQARVLIPQILRGTAKLDAEVVVMGKIDHLEVYNQAMFEANLPVNSLTPDDRKAVAAILNGRSSS
jgi:MraZ protein